VLNAGKIIAAFRRASPDPERRLHERATLYWERAREKREFVSLGEFDWLSLEDNSSHAFLLKLSDGGGPVFTYIGPVLRDEAGVEEEEILLKDAPQTSLLVRFGTQYANAVELAAPVTADYDFVTAAGYRVLCRGALLPLSESGFGVDHVFGVISWKSEKV
jgi:hypothetical protein